VTTKQRSQSEPNWTGTAFDAEFAGYRRLKRTALLAVVLFGVAVLIVVAWQLLTLEWTPQDINKLPRDLPYWRSEEGPQKG